MPTRTSTLPRELLRLAGALAVAFLLVTAVAVSADLAGVSEPNRLGRRLLVPLFILVYAASLRLRRPDLLPALGVLPFRGAARAVGLGLAAGAVALLALDAAWLLAGAREFKARIAGGELSLRIVLFLFQALGIATLEELLFRGLLVGRLMASSRAAVAVTLGSVLFAVAHFLEPLRSNDPSPAWRTALDCLQGLSRIPLPRWKELIGLTLVGLVLTVLRVRSGSIWLPLGVHAGWVWIRFVSVKVINEVDVVMDEHGFLFGTKRIYDGLAGWVALAVTLALVLLFRSGGVAWRQRKS